MADTEITKKPTARSRARAKAETPEAEQKVEPKETTKRTVAKKPPIKPKKLDLNMYVTVRNGFPGLLVYVSKRTGETFLFEGFGTEHEMELQELKSCKNNSKGFFENNWFLIDDPEVIEFLGVGEYYRNAFSYAEFEAMADMTADEIAEKMKHISPGQKLAVTRYAARLIREGRIDSLKVIKTLEDGLGVQLTEK